MYVKHYTLLKWDLDICHCKSHKYNLCSESLHCQTRAYLFLSALSCDDSLFPPEENTGTALQQHQQHGLLPSPQHTEQLTQGSTLHKLR